MKLNIALLALAATLTAAPVLAITAEDQAIVVDKRLETSTAELNADSRMIIEGKSNGEQVIQSCVSEDGRLESCFIGMTLDAIDQEIIDEKISEAEPDSRADHVAFTLSIEAALDVIADKNAAASN